MFSANILLTSQVARCVNHDCWYANNSILLGENGMSVYGEFDKTSPSFSDSVLDGLGVFFFEHVLVNAGE